jgi:hypothetical protein
MKYLKTKDMSDQLFSEKELEEFRLDPTINPKTKRKISEKGSIYKKLVTLINKKDSNLPPKLIVKKLREKSKIP